MTGMWLNILGAAICFGMFFGFGPSPDNQLVPAFGFMCLFFAKLCYDHRTPRT